MKVEVFLMSVLFLVICAEETCNPERDSDCQETSSSRDNKYVEGDLKIFFKRFVFI